MGWSEAVVNQLYEAVGVRIRNARQRANLTQTELAQRLDMTRSSVANFEAGRQRVTLHTLLQIAEELKTPAAELLVEPAPSLEATSSNELAAELDGQPETTAEFVTAALRRAE